MSHELLCLQGLWDLNSASMVWQARLFWSWWGYFNESGFFGGHPRHSCTRDGGDIHGDETVGKRLRLCWQYVFRHGSWSDSPDPGNKRLPVRCRSQIYRNHGTNHADPRQNDLILGFPCHCSQEGRGSCVCCPQEAMRVRTSASRNFHTVSLIVVKNGAGSQYMGFFPCVLK